VFDRFRQEDASSTRTAKGLGLGLTVGPARGGGMPAIALTAFARSEDRTRALHPGFLVHVSKSREPSELVATVASVVEGTGTHTTR
jgi:CheY-like chemotaxis protein